MSKTAERQFKVWLADEAARHEVSVGTICRWKKQNHYQHLKFRRVSASVIFVSGPDLPRPVARQPAPIVTTNSPRLWNLSSRELQIVMLLANSRTMKEASAALGVGQKTGYTFLERAFAKLRVRNIVQLTHLALAEGLVQNLYAK